MFFFIFFSKSSVQRMAEVGRQNLIGSSTISIIDSKPMQELHTKSEVYHWFLYFHHKNQPIRELYTKLKIILKDINQHLINSNCIVSSTNQRVSLKNQSFFYWFSQMFTRTLPIRKLDSNQRFILFLI